MIDNHFLNTTRIKDKRVLITGGSTGIGRAIAILLASFGAQTMIVARHLPDLEGTIAEIKRKNDDARVFGIQSDVATPEGIQTIFDQVRQQWGGLDILVNNAALGYGGISEGDYEEWEYVIKTNLLAYLACTHHALKMMEPKGNGHILNIGSMSADVREKDSSVYVATKAAIQGFSEALRKEVNAKGIQVSLIEPGAVSTPMQPMSDDEKEQMIAHEEMLSPESIAKTALFVLCQNHRTSIVEVKIKPLNQII